MAGSIALHISGFGNARLPLIFLTVMLTTGCAGLFPAAQWPADMPERSYFERQWRQDSVNQRNQDQAEYLLWVKRFYQGYNMVPGWLDMTQQVLERVPAAQRDAARERLATLGLRIGGEWAKNNELRLVNTRVVAAWRDALVESLAQDDLFNYLDRVDADVEALLAGGLDKEQIRFERYYEDDFEF